MRHFLSDGAVREVFAGNDPKRVQESRLNRIARHGNRYGRAFVIANECLKHGSRAPAAIYQIVGPHLVTRLDGLDRELPSRRRDESTRREAVPTTKLIHPLVDLNDHGGVSRPNATRGCHVGAIAPPAIRRVDLTPSLFVQFNELINVLAAYSKEPVNSQYGAEIWHPMLPR